MRKRLKMQFRRGGERFWVTPAEHLFMAKLLAESPNFVSKEDVMRHCRVSPTVMRWMVHDLRPLIEMESGAIEQVQGRGYRVISVGKFQ